MNTKFLETFVWLARLGSFSKTAEQLHATQPAISSRISALEDMLGLELYLRGSRPLELTPEGKQALVYAEKIIESEKEMVEAFSSRTGENSMKIGVIEIVTVTWLTDFIKKLSASYDDVVLEITTGLHSDLVDSLLQRELDIVLSLGPSSDPRLNNVPLCNYEMHWVASPRHFDTGGELDVLDIAKLPIILTKSNSSVYPVVRNALMSYGLDYVFSNNQKIKIDCVYSLTTAVHLVKEGVGVMPLMPAVISDEIKNGALEVLNVRERLPDLHITALHLADDSRRLTSEFSAMAQEQAREFCRSQGSQYAKP